MMDEIYTQGLMHFGNVIRSEGWSPLVCIAMRHGKVYTFHFYALKDGEADDKFASFVFSTDQNVVRDSFRVFKTTEEGNADFIFTKTMARYIPHCQFDLTGKEVA